MQIVGTVFLYLNLLVCVLALTAYQIQYRKLKRQGFGFNNAEDAYDFVQHFLLCVWWAVGIFVVAALGLSPFWIIAWFLAGLVIGVVAKRFAQVGGLSMFISMGEVEFSKRTQEIAAKFDTHIGSQTETLQGDREVFASLVNDQIADALLKLKAK